MLNKLTYSRLTMSVLLLICVNMFFIYPVSANQVSHNSTKSMIVQTAKKLGVDPYIALSLAKIESNFNPNLKSSAGAIGLFQLTPNTAKSLGINPYINSENIEGGLKYYQMLYKKYGSIDLALAAYNAGPGNVAKYNGVPPFNTTKAFISNIKKEYSSFKTDSTTKTLISDTL